MKFISWVIFSLTILLYLSVLVSPVNFPYAGLLPFLIPGFLLINLFLFLILGFSLKKSAFIPLAALLFGYKFFLITYQYNLTEENSPGLKVLTYNAHLFDYKRRTTGEFDPNIFTWLKDHPAEIKVFQEFYQDNTSATKDALKILSKDGEYEYSYHPNEGNQSRRSVGMAIFSKYPIVNEGVVFDAKYSNGAIFADIRVNSDTIRVYNTHLESMAIQAEALDNYEQAKAVYRKTLGKLHRGSLARAEQLEILFEHLSNSPHPVIVMGDFNEIPYSYAYFRLSQKLENAFELAGKGFGFTYNRVLFFLRIDHIFADPSLKPVYFHTHREVDYSDHYPVSATFTWDGMN
ncbi:endonuclease/exonuclease/phosphatase family metal-dependent hydrolase [Algoriphagus boseongensis]|uniref:Endonuclease/exonuclease/phosphatase family metal-dependent hydrolase n=1 Tax=Algoriphagus boseongensis TaxID=1442587 RepID=A0A4R6TA67_9BACT|nr:endonuclease/exonuclease/phosphatase family protein [Algoriphagus boseongensis]TDQ19656.1 endonuclease/exonuclease/phosphatase family metal-dependent hydrolase [Algoriphagus boseongensis]